MPCMNGYILIDKPTGWTSFDVVAKVRGMVRATTGVKRSKVGHCGTLDPLATGLLVIVVGSYCKRAQEFSKLDKTYDVTMRLGQTSTTGDEEGDKTNVNDHQPTEQEIKSTLLDFRGEIMQTPHAFSAIKVNGQRAYDMARVGKDVVLEPRPVLIHEITFTSYSYPEVKFTAHVGSGTYIRSLVEDIGKQLGTGAYMSSLRRTSVGNWYVDNARPITDIKSLTQDDLSVI